MKLKCEKEYKCPLCKDISNHIEVYSGYNTIQYFCPKCSTEMFYSISYIANVCWELNISKKEGELYHNNKKVECIEIDNNKEMVFKYK